MARTARAKKVLKDEILTTQAYKLVYNKGYRAGKKTGWGDGYGEAVKMYAHARKTPVDASPVAETVEVNFIDRVVMGMKSFLRGPN